MIALNKFADIAPQKEVAGKITTPVVTGRARFGFAPVGEKLVRPPQPHLFDPRFQRGRFDAEPFRRAVGTLDFPIGFSEGGQEVVAFAPLPFRFGQDFRFRGVHFWWREARRRGRGVCPRQIEVQRAAARKMMARLMTFRSSRMLPGQ